VTKAVTVLDRIAELWAKGVVTREIGEALDIPKNSVCRLVFNARRDGDARFPARAFAAPGKPKTPKLIMRPAMPRRKRPPYPEPKPRAVHPRIYELRAHECRYAVKSGERGDHFFCAKPQEEGSAYCPEHKALCAGTWRPRAR
jgi:hypothetical protein